MSLFRSAALDAHQTKWLGSIVLARPLSFTLMTTAGVAMGAALVALMAAGSYTRHMTIAGQLVPDGGLVKVFAPQSGIVLQRNVAEGQAVAKGDTLYVLSGERHGAADADVQAAISRNVGLRAQSLREELSNTRRIQQDEQGALNRRIDMLRNELAKAETQRESQQSRVQLCEEALQRAQDLVAKGYLSKEQLQTRQAELLDQRNRLQELERGSIATGRELAALQSEMASLPLRHKNQLGQLERLLASTGEELTESEARRHIIVAAPQAGIATAVTAAAGQLAHTDRPLASIVPAHGALQAELYAPSSAIGFIRPADRVLLRYQAYPYQKFGHARGTVTSVSRTALPAAELSANISIQAGSGQPLYLIKVALESQFIHARGVNHPLQSGLLLEADIQQEKRRLYEWVLEPLYSLTGKL
jgi:membrane fusion protein